MVKEKDKEELKDSCEEEEIQILREKKKRYEQMDLAALMEEARTKVYEMDLFKDIADNEISSRKSDLEAEKQPDKIENRVIREW